MRRRTLTAGDLADAVSFLVNGKPESAPRALWLRMAGEPPPPVFSSNGCGPVGPGIRRAIAWLVPDRMHGWSFLLPCHFHDWAYGEGGGRKAQRQADWELSLNIVAAIAAGGGTCSAPRAFGIALLYWLGVRTCGRLAFKRGLAARKRPSIIETIVLAPAVAARLLWVVARP